VKARSTPEFMSTAMNDFLFAAVGTEANGMSLSLVSVFARQGSDPWREAGQLADLPKAQATERLAQAIARMPGSEWNLPQATDIATRLVGLLPARQTKVALEVISSGWNWNPLTPANLLLIGGVVVAGFLVATFL
jgi:hypothetical protein